ncbi:MAG: hypothetical protein SH848_02045 [Saprospiraceae bacterium]|nr:hypothetical protein [Saprospiraceae bacterium]
MNTLKHVAYFATTIFCLFVLATDGTAQSASGQNPLMLLNRNNSGLPNGTTAPVVTGDTLGDIRFQGLISGLGYRPGATIQSYVSGPVGPDFVTSSLLFRTGTPRPVMRMTIRENGFVGVNTFTPQQLLTVSHATRPVVRFDRANGGELDYEVYAGNSGTLFFRGGGDGTEGALTDFMVLTSVGHLGVGTTTPSQLVTLSAPNAPVFRFERSDGGATDYEILNGDNGTLFFRGGNDATGAALPNRMVLTAGGNLGLGTITPDRLLTISANTEPIFRFNRSTAGGQDVELAASTDGDLFFRGGADGTTLNDLMVLKGNGKLAIGTLLTPNSLGGTDLSAYTLYAKGGILSEEVRVRTGWADYVFAPGYRLRSLEEVETHIAQFGHLPETPSAAQVAAQGLELGDNAVNQQAKIEELFLYMIEMNKQMKALQTENATLRSRVEALENK